MSNTKECAPRISIFNENKVLLHECVCPPVKGEHNLKHLIESLKTVQKEANVFLTKLVEEAQTSQITSNKNTDDADAEDDDDDDDEDENGRVDHFHPKRQKRQ